MPGTYCYQCARCSRATELVRPSEDRNRSVRCECGFRMDRDLGLEHAPNRQAGKASWSDFKSEAAAVHPDDVPKFKRHDSRMGVPTDYDREGRPVFRDRTHRSKYLKAHHLVDLDAGYSD